MVRSGQFVIGGSSRPPTVLAGRIAWRKIIVQQIKIGTIDMPSSLLLLLSSCLSSGLDKPAARCILPLATVSLGLSLLIFCQASARRKTSTIAAPNIEKLLNN
jgi:hypothetical protein